MMENSQTSPAKQPSAPDYLWVAIVLALLLILLAYGVAWQLAFWAFYLAACCFIAASINPKQWLAGFAGMILLGYIVVAVIPNCGLRIHNKARNAEVRQNLTTVRLTIERYAVDHGSYPDSIHTLVADGFELPDNPYLRCNGGLSSETTPTDRPSHMLPVNEDGWPEDLGDIAGDFIYLPQMQVVDGHTIVTGYDLIAFGKVTQSHMRENLFPVDDSVPILHLASD